MRIMNIVNNAGILFILIIYLANQAEHSTLAVINIGCLVTLAVLGIVFNLLDEKIIEKELKEINDKLDDMKYQLTIINNCQGFNFGMIMIVLIVLFVSILIAIVLH